MRRPARRRRRDDDAADGRGRRAAQPGRPHARRDPTGLDGAILRVNPDTGAALPNNPNAGSPDPNARRIVAYGLRNPFRITVRPGTNEVWAGDVGWNVWEEINRVPNPTGADAQLRLALLRGHRAGWRLRQPEPQPLRDALQPGRGRPRGAVLHVQPLLARRPGRDVPDRLLVDLRPRLLPAGGSFRPAYDGALFFSDYSRNCIWAMLAGSNGLPDPDNRQTFVAGRGRPGRAPVRPRRRPLLRRPRAAATIRRFRVADHEPRPDRAARPRRRPTAPCRSPSTSTAAARATPTARRLAVLRLGPRRRRRRSTTRRRRRRAAPTRQAGTYTARLRVTRPRRARRTPTTSPITAGSPPVPISTITSPAAGHDLGGRRHDRLQRHGDRLPGQPDRARAG